MTSIPNAGQVPIPSQVPSTCRSAQLLPQFLAKKGHVLSPAHAHPVLPEPPFPHAFSGHWLIPGDRGRGLWKNEDVTGLWGGTRAAPCVGVGRASDCGSDRPELTFRRCHVSRLHGLGQATSRLFPVCGGGKQCPSLRRVGHIREKKT